MVFGESAAKPVPPQMPVPGPKPAAKPGDVARSTMMFGAPQPRIQAAPAAAVPTPEPAASAEPPASPEPALEEPSAIDGMPPPSAGEAEVPAGEAPADAAPAAEADEIADEPAREPGTFDRAPPRALLVGVAAGLVLLLAVGGGLVAYRKLGRRAPPAAAVETLSAAQADAEKDSLASIASAETKARDALDVAGPRARFPEATAALARVEIQWADALTDQASRIAEKDADDPRAAQLQSEAKAKVKAAFDLLSPAAKANAGSTDLQLAFADYYRAKRLPSSMGRYLKDLKDEPRAALIEGLAFLQEDDGAEKALPKLKTALAASPQSARIHYRLAVAHLALKNEGSARAELKETLRLSPQHERAQALLEQLGGSAERK
jgi:tetratricopeptide repeat protein